MKTKKKIKRKLPMTMKKWQKITLKERKRRDTLAFTKIQKVLEESGFIRITDMFTYFPSETTKAPELIADEHNVMYLQPIGDYIIMVETTYDMVAKCFSDKGRGKVIVANSVYEIVYQQALNRHSSSYVEYLTAEVILIENKLQYLMQENAKRKRTYRTKLGPLSLVQHKYRYAMFIEQAHPKAQYELYSNHPKGIGNYVDYVTRKKAYYYKKLEKAARAKKKK